MPLLDELDATLLAGITDALKRRPSLDTLRAATLIETEPSPAMLEGTARWLDAATATGATPAELLRAALMFGPPYPSGDLLMEWLGADEAATVCERLADLPEDERSRHETLASVALARAAETGALRPEWRALFGWTSPTGILRKTLAPLSLVERERLVLPVSVPLNGTDASYIVERMLSIADLIDTPALLAARAAAFAQVDDDHDRAFLERRMAEGTTAPSLERPTKDALVALDYWLEQHAAAERRARLGPLLQTLWSERALRVAAITPETIVAALRASEPSVAWSVVGTESFGGPVIIVLDRDGVRFCVVPGGDAEVGLSEDELALIDRHAAIDKGPNHFEQYESIRGRLPLMRPLTRVAIGPMLVQQGVGNPMPPDQVSEMLASSIFRLPSEAEWEYLARGGVARELTYRGNTVPVSNAWLPDSFELGAGGANRFGLWGFGFEPELCADVFVATLVGLPHDGSPRRGDGPRVARGGAGQVYPWQAVGEWQLLLSAMREDARAWHNVALRLTLPIVTAD